MKSYNAFQKKDKDNEVATDSKYQSTFLPIFQKAETRIKMLILFFFINMKSKAELRLRINAIISLVAKKIPMSLENRDAYINGLFATSNKMISLFYDKPRINFDKYVNVIKNNFPKGENMPKIDTPKDLLNIVNTKPSALKVNMWSESKASVRVMNYNKEIQSYIGNMSKTTMVTSESGKKPISLWQKAELDIRHQKQMDKLQELKDDGIQYAWTSSHPDCSERCEPWQGKLFDITSEHSELSGFRMDKKLDGNQVYCLNEIMNQVDDYGYKNNIISGFNCRHYLIPYQKNIKPVSEYTKGEIAKQRKIESNIKDMERKIRYLKQQEIGYNKSNAKSNFKYSSLIKKKIEQYKQYCNANGYAWEKYRIDV